MSFLSWLENISYQPGVQQPISLRPRSQRIPFRLKRATRIVAANKDRWYNEDGSIKAGLGRRDYRRALRFSRKLPLAELFALDTTPMSLIPKPTVQRPAVQTSPATFAPPPAVPEEKPEIKQEVRQDLSQESPKPEDKPTTPVIPKAWQERMAQHAAILQKRYKDDKDFHFNDNGSYTNRYGTWIPVYVGGLGKNWSGPNPGTVYINIKDQDAYNRDELVSYYLVTGNQEYDALSKPYQIRRGDTKTLNFKLSQGGTLQHKNYFRLDNNNQIKYFN